MIKRLMWAMLVVVAGLLLADLVVLNVYVLRMRQQTPVSSAPGSAADSFGIWWRTEYTPPDEPQYWEWYRKSTSYVSDRPDLTGIVEPERVAFVHQQVANYFETRRLEVSDARDLRYAYTPRGKILRFSLSREKLTQFLENRQPVAEPAKQVLSDLFRDGRFDLGEYGRYTGLQYAPTWFLEYPFVRLTWWPINLADAEQMVAYGDTITWKTGMSKPGAHYFIFVDEKTGLIYLIGP